MENFNLIAWAFGLAHGLILFFVYRASRGIEDIKRSNNDLKNEQGKVAVWKEMFADEIEKEFTRVRAHINRLYDEGKAQGTTAALLTEIRDRLPEK